MRQDLAYIIMPFIFQRRWLALARLFYEGKESSCFLKMEDFAGSLWNKVWVCHLNVRKAKERLVISNAEHDAFLIGKLLWCLRNKTPRYVRLSGDKMRDVESNSASSQHPVTDYFPVTAYSQVSYSSSHLSDWKGGGYLITTKRDPFLNRTESASYSLHCSLFWVLLEIP